MILRVTPQAKSDIFEAARWYEGQEPELGIAFVEQIDAVLQRIEQGPERYPISYRNLRHALARRFPYAIYFTHHANDIVVFAVLHQRRNLKILGERLEE